jgi:pimeloyl-ACP methyl ester carboxylesterase
MSRRFAVLATGVILLAVGCRTTEPITDPIGSDAPTGTVPSYAAAPCPNPIYGGIDALDVGAEYTCGYLTVPENRSKPDGRTIRLAVATRKAAAPNPKPDPIVFLTGGPGGSGLAEGPGVATDWHRDRDVIFLDQRGTLKSDPFLSCPEIDAFMERTVELSWSDPATAEQSSTHARACRDRLAGAGADLAAYNTTQSAADVADLRIAMGVDKWNIYGISYGSDLALQVLRDHPSGIRSVVVDAVLPPNVNPMETGWRAAKESISAIYDACAAEPACHAAYPDGMAEYTQVINDLAAEPRTVKVTDPRTGQAATVVIDATKLAYTVQFGTLIGSPPKIPSLIHDLAVGDGSEAALEILAGVFPPDFNSYGLQWGVLCREMIGRTDPEHVRAAGERELPDFPASVTATPAMFPFAFTDCAKWDVPAGPAQARTAATSDIPVLLTSGAFDGTAPPSYAAEAAKTLSNSTHIVFPGIGHGASRWASTCFATVMAGFLDRPTATVDDSCVNTLAVPPFEIPDQSDAGPATPAASTTALAQRDFAGLVDVGGGRQVWATCQGQGSPTVVLLSGKGNGAQDWSQILAPDDPVHQTPGDDLSAGMGTLVASDHAVYPTMARTTRVCTYDRPDIRTTGEVTTPRPQPHTVDLDVADLHALLTAIGEPGPYVLVSHSYGGLISTLYARTYPEDIAGLVMVDTASEALEDLVTPGALDWWDEVNAATNDVVREGVMIKDAFAQINAAGPMPDVPAIVLVADKPYREDLIPPELLQGEHTTFADWVAMVNTLGDNLGAKTITKTNSGHNIYMYNPQLVIDSINQIVDNVRAAG